MDELSQILIDAQKAQNKSSRAKDRIILVLIILMFLEAVAGYSGFVWYSSQFETVETTTTETTDNSDIDITTNGENASAEYIEGNQYNDSSTHNDNNKK